MSTALASPSSLSTSLPPDTAPQMEFTIHRDSLLAELSLAQNLSAANKSTVPELNYVLLNAQTNRVSISSSNLEEGLRTSASAHVRQEGSALLPARRLLDYIRLLGAGEISFKLLPNAWVQIRAGRSSTKMAGLDAKRFPVLPSTGSTTARRLPADLLRAFLPRVTYAISTEDSRYTLKGALLTLEPDRVTMVATDGHRLAKVERSIALEGTAAEESVLIPARALAMLQILLSNSKATHVSFHDDGNMLFFELGGRLLTTRKMSGHFPAYKAVIPKTKQCEVLLPTSECERSVKRVLQFADQHTQAVQLTLHANTARLSSRSEQNGESEDVIETPYAGNKFVTGLNAGYILDFLHVVSGEQEVQLELNGPDSAVVFRPVSTAGDDYVYIVMPLRI